jgi:hypothetical protein
MKPDARSALLTAMAVALIAAGLDAGTPAGPRSSAPADRALYWTTASDAGLERELNTYGARGLRVAATSDGLPCTVTVMQTPERAPAPVAYRVVADKDLGAAIASLPETGFVPVVAHRSLSTREMVIFERVSAERAAPPWRLIEFAQLEELEGALAAAARDGFQARVVVRPAFRSWPGLSKKGMVLAVRAGSGAPREARVLVGTSRNVDNIAKELSALTAAGWTLDGLFSSARDGSRDGKRETRRERLVAMLSRDPAAKLPEVKDIKLERTSSFGIFGSGLSAGAAPFWNEYVYAWTPAPRHHTWASPIRLSDSEAQCAGLSFKLRIDAPRDHTWSIVGLIARPLETGGYELIYLTDQGV